MAFCVNSGIAMGVLGAASVKLKKYLQYCYNSFVCLFFVLRIRTDINALPKGKGLPIVFTYLFTLNRKRESTMETSNVNKNLWRLFYRIIENVICHM